MANTRIEMPSVKERCLRAIMAGAMALSVGAGALAAPAAALADTGSVTIAATGANTAPNTYKAYKVFTASVDENDKASGIAWNDAYKADVITFLNANGYGDWLTANGHTDSGAAENAQNAADFIASKVSAGAWDTDAGTTPQTPAAGSFAAKLAQALAGKTATGTATAGTAFTGDEGLWLFVSDDANVAAGEAGMAAIWVPLGGSTTRITEKNALPTVNKQVKEDKTSTWGKAADADEAQEVDYLITGTLPDNIGAFKSYHYKFEDQLPAGKMELQNSDTSSVVVKVGEEDVTDQVTVGYANSKLTVDIENLFALTDANDDPISIDKDMVVTVEYQAHLTTASTIGSAGNENEVELTYTADPVSLVDKGGLKSVAKAFTYQLDVVKADKQTGEALAGAKYTVKTAGEPTYVEHTDGEYYRLLTGEYTTTGPTGADASEYYVDNNNNVARYMQQANDLYVQADGSLAATPYKFTTDGSGKFSVPRIDEGTYTIAETDPAPGYQVQDADITVTITSTLDQSTGAVTALSATVSGGETSTTNAGDVVTHLAASADETPYSVGAPDVATGKVGIVTSDDKTITLPITGLDGVATVVVGGGAAVVLGGAVLALTRKRKGEE